VGVNFSMTRLCGWGGKYVRVEGYVPVSRFECTSILSSVCLLGVNTWVSFESVLNGEFFALYVKYVSVPALSGGFFVFGYFVFS